MRSNVVISLFFLFSLVTTGCDSTGVGKTMVMHFNSPNNRITISVVKFSYDATVPFVYKLYLHPYNTDPLEIKPEFDFLRVDSIKGLKITWVNDMLANIKCVNGNIYKFTSIGQSNNDRIRLVLNASC